ncbi:MAG: penicillin-binding transpeptidase domain-containing protein [Actinomycetota bacterium]|nr:penicillin-binding transpeptidase domain-containing protein [Actinomycetota bacterium]
MNGPIRRLAAVLFLAFAVVVVDLTYLQVVAGPRYRDHPRNARVVISQSGRERGPILSLEGEVLAESVVDPDQAQQFIRRYPHPELYAHVIGYSALLFGQTGVEATHSSELRSGRDVTISGLIRALMGADLRPKGIRLTISHQLQQTARQAMGGARGAVLALDPATGAVLAMVSTPSFDPNLLVAADRPDIGEQLQDDPARPLLNRAIAQTYAPGSSFKVVTAGAALESGSYNAESTFPDPQALELPGSTSVIRNFDQESCAGGAQVTLTQALVRSCNTIFGMLGMEVGAERMVTQAEAFGFNQEIPLELPTLTSHFPPVEAFENNLPALAQSAIGQRDVQATALQMALVAAGMANGGVLMTPYVVGEVFNQDGEVVQATEPIEWRRGLSPASATVLAGMMEQVVTAGTGRQAAIPNVRVAGKTGTAEVPEAPPHAWFMAFAPIEQPRIALAVVVENGGEAGESATGGGVAAPIAQQVLAAALGLGG